MKKAIALVLILMSIHSPIVSAFSDIRDGSTLDNMIQTLEDEGILSGYPDGSFRPEQSINRAEALKIIFATVQEKNIPSISENPFPDVPKNQWFAPYISAAKDRGVIKGYPDGNYRPDQFVNRAEFIHITMNALPFYSRIPQDKGKAIASYEDVHDPLWYTNAVSAALELEFLPHLTYLRPTEPMQRQEAAEIIFTIHQYLKNNPQSTSSTKVPYVPKEALLVIDPTTSHQYNPKEFGPDKLIIKRGPEGTEIFNKYSGYNVSIPELVSAKALEISDWQLTIDYFNRQCMMDIYSTDRDGRTAKDFHDELYAVHPIPPLTEDLSSFVNPQGTTINRTAATWENMGDTETYFILTDTKVHQFSAFGYGGNDSDNCQHLVPEIAETFTIR